MGRNIEDKLTTACSNFMQFKYPRPKYLWWHTPNGGSRNKIEASKFKRMGVLAGVPDMEIAEPVAGYPGLYIELKSEFIDYDKGKEKATRDYPKEHQRELLVRLHQKGYAVDVCWNIDQFMDTVNSYMDGEFEPSDYTKGMLERELEKQES